MKGSPPRFLCLFWGPAQIKAIRYQGIYNQPRRRSQNVERPEIIRELPFAPEDGEQLHFFAWYPVARQGQSETLFHLFDISIPISLPFALFI